MVTKSELSIRFITFLLLVVIAAQTLTQMWLGRELKVKLGELHQKLQAAAPVSVETNQILGKINDLNAAQDELLAKFNVLAANAKGISDTLSALDQIVAVSLADTQKIDTNTLATHSVLQTVINEATSLKALAEQANALNNQTLAGLSQMVQLEQESNQYLMDMNKKTDFLPH